MSATPGEERGASPLVVDPALVAVLERSRSLGYLGPGSVRVAGEHALGFAAGVDAPPARLLDLGSGGGVPGLVLAARWLTAEVVLLDASERRCVFLAEAVEELGWDGRVTVLRARAEEAGRRAELRGSFDVVVARAFGPPPVTAECGAPFLRVGGRLIVSEPPWPAAGEPSPTLAAPPHSNTGELSSTPTAPLHPNTGELSSTPTAPLHPNTGELSSTPTGPHLTVGEPLPSREAAGCVDAVEPSPASDDLEHIAAGEPEFDARGHLDAGGSEVESDVAAAAGAGDGGSATTPERGPRWPADGVALVGLALERSWSEPFHYQSLVLECTCPDRFPRRTGVPAKRPLF